MGQDLAASSAAAADVWREADDALGESISSLAWTGPEDALNLTVNSQPAILACSIAYLRALEERLSGPGAEAALTPDFFAGHSMGQYSAMVAAGVISLGDGVRLVRERGTQMQASAEDGSMAAVIGGSGQYVDYAASKGAIDTFTVGLAREVADEGIRVNAVRPGIIETDIHASGGTPDRAWAVASQIPMKRPGSSDEVADAVVFLLSNQASYITGAILNISGGR